jgi:hypothetical protein
MQGKKKSKTKTQSTSREVHSDAWGSCTEEQNQEMETSEGSCTADRPTAGTGPTLTMDATVRAGITTLTALSVSKEHLTLTPRR